MLLLINDLLDIAAIESGKITLNKEKTDIEELLNLENYSMKIMADHKNINIETIIFSEIPELNIDKNRMHQVIDNLLSNAVKFSYQNTTITIKAEKENNEVAISIIDQGQGNSEKDLSKLFKPFEKTSTKPTNKESSTGLGLVIVKKIVELHNGRIEVSSKQLTGSTFKVLLPL